MKKSNIIFGIRKIKRAAFPALVITLGLFLIAMNSSAAEWKDDFESNRLRPEWFWINEDPSHWSATNRPYLTIITQKGGHIVKSNNAKNLLLRPVPEGDFIIQTLVRFDPVQNFQFAGLLIFQDFNNLLALGRGYCEILNSAVYNLLSAS